MTSFSWVSGSRESSRNCMWALLGGSGGAAADDARALHFPDGRPVIHDGVMLGAAIIPEGHAVGLPAPADLIFGDCGAADQIGEQIGRAGRIILAVADVLGGVEVGEVGREAVDE